MKRLFALLGYAVAAWIPFFSIPCIVVADDQPRNVLLICVDDLRPELACFGADYIKSPNIDRLASEGRSFIRHYVNAPSCGPSRYTLLTGRYGPSQNDALFLRAEKMQADRDAVHPSMPEWFRSHGYTTVSVGKVSHHPGGRGGRRWADGSVIEMPNAWDRHLMPVGEWQDPEGSMHGLANGEIRSNASEMDVFQSVAGPDSIYPDGLITEEALAQLDQLATDKSKPFFLAVGIIKPHLPFGAPKKYLDLYDGVQLPPIPHPKKPAGTATWSKSGEFMRYNRWGKDPREDEAFATAVRRHYAACVSFADAQVGQVLERLKQTGADQNTVVVLWGDHGWHLGEFNVWGKHTLFEEALHSPLIVAYPGLGRPGEQTAAVVETLDIFPTLCDLTGIAAPDFAQGVTLKPIIEKPESAGHPAAAYWNGATSIRTAKHRLILRKGKVMELYNFSDPATEAVNVLKDHPDIVTVLKQTLSAKLTK